MCYYRFFSFISKKKNKKLILRTKEIDESIIGESVKNLSKLQQENS